jgi:hypothetical protein
LGALVLATALVSSGRVAASPMRPGFDLNEMLTTADFVFRGRVVDVAYRNAEPQPDAELAPPYTFVTYEVSQVMKGPEGAGAKVTLRFRGGPIDETNFLSVSGAPLFDLGDEDVLLVQGNTRAPCPLVECEHGRFRLIEDRVYTELGQSVEWTPTKTLATGPAYALEPVLHHRMTDTIQLAIEDSDLDPTRKPDRETHAMSEDFVAYVADTVRATHSAQALAAVPPVVSADITQPFADDVVALSAAASPARARTGSAAAPASPAVHAALPSALDVPRAQGASAGSEPAAATPATPVGLGAWLWVVLLLGIALVGAALGFRNAGRSPRRV